MSCLILIGMMGAGKTTVGKELARRRKLRFADCDQEIVARTHFLGKAKRATVLLHGIDEGVAAGSAVLAADASIGQIACVAAPYALAVLPLEREDLPLSVDGLAVSPLPLLDGLQR